MILTLAFLGFSKFGLSVISVILMLFALETTQAQTVVPNASVTLAEQWKLVAKGFRQRMLLR